MSDPGGRNAWLTPENLPSGTRTFTVPVSDDLEWIAIFKGALALLTNSDNFQQFGTQTPADVAERFMEMFLEIGEDMMPIGTILPFAGSVLPDKFLWATDGLINVADYPDLYDVIGNVFADGRPYTTGVTFYLPDLKARVPVGAHSGYPSLFSLGQDGGEITHVLTIDEMPSHNHALSYNSAGANGYQAVKLQSTVQGTAATQYTGGSGGHNNLQPYLTLNYIIKAQR